MPQVAETVGNAGFIFRDVKRKMNYADTSVFAGALGIGTDNAVAYQGVQQGMLLVMDLLRTYAAAGDQYKTCAFAPRRSTQHPNQAATLPSLLALESKPFADMPNGRGGPTVFIDCLLSGRAPIRVRNVGSAPIVTSGGFQTASLRLGSYVWNALPTEVFPTAFVQRYAVGGRDSTFFGPSLTRILGQDLGARYVGLLEDVVSTPPVLTYAPQEPYDTAETVFSQSVCGLGMCLFDGFGFS